MLPHWAPWEFIDIPERGHDQPAALILDQTRKRGITGFLREKWNLYSLATVMVLD
jgi:hypothetical protein